MRKIFFDIETQNTFDEVGSAEPAALSISLVGIYDSKTDTYESFLENELAKLWPILEKADLLIGYNSLHFDLPLLNKYYHGDLSRIPHLDLMNEVRNVFGRRVKLDNLAAGTLGKNKSGHGLEAIIWWRKGEIDKIRQYCLDDVKITKELYEYAKKNKKLLLKEGMNTIEIKMNTKGWDRREDDSSLTFSLPF